VAVATGVVVEVEVGTGVAVGAAGQTAMSTAPVTEGVIGVEAGAAREATAKVAAAGVATVVRGVMAAKVAVQATQANRARAEMASVLRGEERSTRVRRPGSTK
jgi:hypothetical protein